VKGNTVFGLPLDSLKKSLFNQAKSCDVFRIIPRLIFVIQLICPPLERAKLPKLTLLDIRHTANSHQIKGDAGIVSVARLLITQT
jgi:hypothetical protein